MKSDCILLHLVGLLFSVNYDARDHELKKCILSTILLIVYNETTNQTVSNTLQVTACSFSSQPAASAGKGSNEDVQEVFSRLYRSEIRRLYRVRYRDPLLFSFNQIA